MHPKDELLRALYDQELPDTQARQVQEHLAHCPPCLKRYNETARRATWAQARFHSLAPGPLQQPRSTSAAYKRFTTQSNSNNPRKEANQSMNNRRPLWTFIAIVAVLAIVFTLTPARAWASDLLGLFRVEKLQVISFDPEEAEANREIFKDNRAAFQRIFDENMKIDEHGEPVQVASAADAAAQVGFNPRLPAKLADATIMIEPGMNAVFTIDQPQLQELADALGADVQLPAEVDGQVVTIDVPDGVEASTCQEGQDKSDCLTLFQMPSPTVNAPEALDMKQIGASMFQFLGLSAEEASQLSQQIDWTNTLVVPVPRGDDIAAKDVSVDGSQGTLFLEQDGERYMLLWVKDGIVYNLRGVGGESEALEVAGSLQ